jgi:hypothetical protein
MGEAIGYALGNWDGLTLFLTDPHLPIDNNASERARVVAPGRKNFLFVGTDEAGENLAGLYSLIATCEVTGVNPVAYLADVLLRCADAPGCAGRRATATSFWCMPCFRVSHRELLEHGIEHQHLESLDVVRLESEPPEGGLNPAGLRGHLDDLGARRQ